MKKAFLPDNFNVDPNDLYNTYARRIHEKSAGTNHTWYWVLAQINGKSVLIGPELTEDDAEQVVIGRGADDWEIFPLPTRDKARASGMVKARKLNQGAMLEKAMEKIRHKGKDIGIS